MAEFDALRVLIVGGRPHATATLRTVLALAGIKNVRAEPLASRALELLRGEAFGAVFCDEQADAIDGVPFPLAARRAPGVLDAMLPIFLVFGWARRRQVERARDDGVTDVLTRPLSAATVTRKLRAAIAQPRPFIVAPDFFGPDRRGKPAATYPGTERRRRAPRKVKLDPTHRQSGLKV